MNPENYHFDLYRILLGDKPLTFLVEVAFRTIIIFGYTLVLVRWMGKRGMGNLTPFEFAIIIALGSAVGDPMFYEDVPLVHTMLVIALIVGMQRGVAWLSVNYRLAERIIESSPSLLIENGMINVSNLHQEQLARDELFEALREQSVRHLGEVEVAYLEPSGNLSVIRRHPEQAGLCVLTDEVALRLPVASKKLNAICCGYCGFCRVASSELDGECPNCQRHMWTEPQAPS